MRRPLLALAVLAACDAAANDAPTPAEAPVQPPFDAAAFAAPKPNPWFPLVPGTVRHYRGTSPEGEVETGTVTVLGPGPTLLGIPTVEVLDEVREGDELVEQTHDFFAEDDQGNTWYFGEDVTNFEYDDKGRLLGRDSAGTWRAGMNGARPGISVPGTPVAGSPATLQEIAPSEEAMDWARTEATGLTLQGPSGSFSEVIRVFESSLTEPESRGYKYYARGVGLVREEELAASGVTIEMTLDLQP